MGGADFVNVNSGELPPTTAGELIVLESGGVPVSQFAFPAQGVLIVGNEELGVSPSLLSKANRRVSIPLAGAKGSLNVGVAVGIALSWWEASLIGGE
jgi:TrmH family RNA methyltransferase